jgi:hypothetical protein
MTGFWVVEAKEQHEENIRKMQEIMRVRQEKLEEMWNLITDSTWVWGPHDEPEEE